MILVTGGTGFIGRHLLERLRRDHVPVRCLVRRKTGASGLPEGVEIARADLDGGEGVAEALEGIEAVIHLAGVTAALRAEEYHAGNVRASGTLARAMAGRGIRLVHVSSLAAIGPAVDGTPVPEDADPHPLTTYGRTKLEGERIVRETVADAVVVRPPVVYGPRDTGVLQILKPIAHGVALEIAGGERWISAIYVKDLVEGLVAAARLPQAAGRSYFLAHPKPVSWSELEQTAAGIMKRRLRVIRVPRVLARMVGGCAEAWSRATGKPSILSREKVAEAECRYWTCDTRRAAAELGFHAETALRAGLQETLAWYREAGWLKY
jgi:nucleoside-diphosphate-sugar epimerase